MRPRRTNSPLLPVNSRHTRGKSSSAGAFLRFILLAAALLIVSYAFVTYRGPSADKLQTPQTQAEESHGKSDFLRTADVAAQTQQQEDSKGDANLEHHNHESHLNELLHPAPSVNIQVHLAHHKDVGDEHQRTSHELDIETHEDGKGGVQDEADKKLPSDQYPDATHQVKATGTRTQQQPDAASPVQPQEVETQAQHPDASHQVQDQGTHPTQTQYPDASHQVQDQGTHPTQTQYPDASHQVQDKGTHPTQQDTHRDDTVQSGHTTQPADSGHTHTEKAGGVTKPAVQPVQQQQQQQGHVAAQPLASVDSAGVNNLYPLEAEDMDGVVHPLRDYALGKVALVVNVASACGYTDENYKGLQLLYEKYRSRGLVILGFPCNQFGGQESGTLTEIRAFCTHNYHVTFPMFAKVEVNGPNTHPVYRFLKSHLPTSQGGGGGKGPGTELTWNFNKFLVNRKGEPVRFFYQHFDRKELEEAVEKLLALEEGIAL